MHASIYRNRCNFALVYSYTAREFRFITNPLFISNSFTHLVFVAIFAVTRFALVRVAVAIEHEAQNLHIAPYFAIYDLSAILRNKNDVV